MTRIIKIVSLGVSVLALGALNLQADTGVIATGVRIPLKSPYAAAQGLGWNSLNWSGYALTAATQPYHSISGTWQVPTVYSDGNHSSTFGSNWIGIDGFNNSDLIQTGTGEEVISGTAQYFAWWEILPSPETLIPTMVVQPGNTMHASITNLGNGEWQITLQNLTLHESFTTDQSYSGPAQSAEWIQEAPTINGSISTLDPYSTFAFSNLSVNGGNPMLEPSDGGVMIQNNVQVSTPSFPSVTGNSFAVAYGSQMPAPPTALIPRIDITLPEMVSTGQVLEIFGLNFGNGPGQVTIDGVNASVNAWSSNLITVTVPKVPAGPQVLTVTTSTGTSVSRTITVINPLQPTIANIFPSVALPGTTVRLMGRNLGNTPGSVVLDNMNAHIDSWSPYMVTFTVPSDVKPGPAPITLITAQDKSVTDSQFTIAQPPSPVIHDIYPSTARIGQTVSIFGSNFGMAKPSVTIGGVSATVESWSPYRITVMVPSVPFGTEPVVVTTSDGSTVKDASFTVINTAAPSIRMDFPNQAPVGTSVRLLGNNFGSQTGTVTLGGTKATIQSWSPYMITFVVPNVSAGSQPLVVTTSGGQSTQTTFTVTPAPSPYISTVYPDPAIPGYPLRIMGNNFGSDKGTVDINGTPLTIQYWTPYFIEAVLPTNLATGSATLTVTTASGATATDTNFSIK
ncbi:MAG: hypothetical protein C7B47_16420 [Sulfobacillus thermosulfidooxidans]|uniref:IPT/TIG domain-containing protein n=1 Tax=Sulfobacillus thermosulfidooxidans TaxID=28034 RepID=A0A2T2WKH8_SULTH|nr:MAG: hypothetical protein C7B47_16420 [Sulfobacillus thermosulfidooxidans]